MTDYITIGVIYMKKISIAVIGLNFGYHFARIYAKHPDVENVYIVDSDDKRLNNYIKEQGTPNTIICKSFDEVLKNPEVDAIHICTGIPSHAEMTTATLNAGKHCACAVPMGISIEEIKDIVETTRKTGKNYMMMETQLYSSPYIKACEMLKNGEFGKVQHMRGVHFQPMEYWAGYWMGLPPMHYATHIIAPLHGIAGSRIKNVRCIGSGTMDEKYTKVYGNPYPIEEAIIEFENGLKGQIVRGLFECAALPTEDFNIYGSERTLMSEYEGMIIEKIYDENSFDKYRWNKINIKWKNYYELLPEELHEFTLELDPEQQKNWKDYLDTGRMSMHGGSHPHLVHEFVRSIIENRKPSINEDISANITAAGICAHISALNNGQVTEIPEF